MQPAYAAPDKTLDNNQWAMISLPANPGASATVRTVFADDLPAATYGRSGQWIVFDFNPTRADYDELTLNSPLEPGKGYWIIQATGSSVVLDVPANAGTFSGATMPGCPSPEGCIVTPLQSDGSEATWQLLGRADTFALPLSSTRIVNEVAPCNGGCTPRRAKGNNLVHDHVFIYDAASGNYVDISESQLLPPWSGFWVAALPRIEARPGQWLQPLYSPGTSNVTPAQRDAARLLSQASFGPTVQDINRVIQLGGASAWIDNQLGRAPSRHLPFVNQQFPEGSGKHKGRYEVFWTHALKGNDQLRQRVAFALSEIMVVSDRPANLSSHGQIHAAFYDELVTHAFGNFRDLIETVTLSPAMGVYLSMLANDKPDAQTGRRSDENYARELMQLFTIGLVELNSNGTSKAGEPATYTQTDVENLARIFTGWSWDQPGWSTDARNGWQPDISTMTRPMKAFGDFHDTDAKQFLGQSFPAGQSARQDLTQALDLLFKHRNVGPFISQRLIQRLVTSNPSPAYVARVASVFNNNGSGVRGDLGAVIRAILLDAEARDTTVAKRSDYGKLREPVLRLSHLWRAFEVQDTIAMDYFSANFVSQHAPLTAPSVFNFFSPSFSPAGVLRDAGLKAPEFQINSESAINNINRTMMIMLQEDRFLRSFSTRLDLDGERGLINSPQSLINRLDLVLFAGSMSPELRRLLVHYMAQNDDTQDVPRERLLRDVIAIAFLSAEYAIQR